MQSLETKSLRPKFFETKMRSDTFEKEIETRKKGLETRLETETKSQDSYAADAIVQRNHCYIAGLFSASKITRI